MAPNIRVLAVLLPLLYLAWQRDRYAFARAACSVGPSAAVYRNRYPPSY